MRTRRRGRTELVRAAPVGHHAHLAAALTACLVANVVFAVLVAVGLSGLGLGSIDPAGSWLFATALAMIGMVFAAVAAVTVQISEHSRAASGMAGLVLGTTYALRAAGDLGDGTLTWLSPHGWAQATRAFVDDRWWPLLPAVVLVPVLVVLAGALSRRRDVGAGLRATRPGPAEAAPSLRSPLALAFRLQRASLLGWCVAMLAFGSLYGSLAGELEGFASEVEAIQDVLAVVGGDVLQDAFLALQLSLLALVTGIHATTSALRARTEETSGRAEPVLATAVSRTSWLGAHLLVAAAGSVVVLLAAALGLGGAAALTLGEPDLLVTMLLAAAAYVPALAVTVGVVGLLVGVAPRATGAAWAVVTYGLFAGVLGGLLGLPDWSLDLSPFAAVPAQPAVPFAATPLVVLSVIAVVVTAVGLAGFARRDLTTGA